GRVASSAEPAAAAIKAVFKVFFMVILSFVSHLLCLGRTGHRFPTYLFRWLNGSLPLRYIPEPDLYYMPEREKMVDLNHKITDY
ncbi:MAG: hypothetical protein K1566_18660, partial [Candidatus Thiodiazotropha sp. (ex. Lucinisca nassula)]|nr:hypothetical protein [Candidatus Thiodiazotropha sp. (ex. Lucinisca nassula)]